MSSSFNSEYFTKHLIFSYLMDKIHFPLGWFTYKLLRDYYERVFVPRYRDLYLKFNKIPDWHTVERIIRKLASQGYLRREKYGKTYKYHVTPKFLYDFINDRFNRAIIENTEEGLIPKDDPRYKLYLFLKKLEESVP